MTASKWELRTVPTEFQVRQDAEGNSTIEGYALKFNVLSQNLGGFRERVAPGATTKTVQEADIRALFNHDPNMVLGRNVAGTMDVSVDGTGTYYRIKTPDTSYARDLMVSMERGDVTQSSFSFRTISDDWSIDESDFPLRTLTEIQLRDVSPVTYPAYLDSTSGVGAQRAFDRLAESRGLDASLVEANLAAVIRGDDIEPDPDATRSAAGTVRTSPLVFNLPLDVTAALAQLRHEGR